MDIKQRLQAFNDDNKPFYIVDHDDGTFSLCLSLSFLGEEYAGFGQEVFNRYASQIGDPVTKRGLYTHGSGYEWENVFKKAFENEKDIGKIAFDCELSGFYCYTHELALLEDFGSRFRAIVEDTDGFARLVSEALSEAAVREKAEEELRSTLRGFLMEHPKSKAEIMTPDGYVCLTAEQGRQLLNDSNGTVLIEGITCSVEELLSQKIVCVQQDLFDDELFKIKTEEAPEENIRMEFF